jgi:hypothetical protein
VLGGVTALEQLGSDPAKGQLLAVQLTRQRHRLGAQLGVALAALDLDAGGTLAITRTRSFETTIAFSKRAALSTSSMRTHQIDPFVDACPASLHN